MRRIFETLMETPLSEALIQTLVEKGYLNEIVARTFKPVSPISSSVQEAASELGKSISEGLKKTLANGMPVEVNIRNLAKHFLGTCEESKWWAKELKAAVKEHGHDEILTAFEQWAEAQTGSFMGRKPVSQFLKNVGSHVGTVTKPVVTNRNLESIETRIAYITSNTVFFTGDYRLKLAQLLKDHGAELVEEAFADFFQSVDDRSLPWAARDFLQRAHIMVNTIKLKKQQAAQQQANLNQAYAAAADSVEQVEEEDEEL